MEPFKFQYWTCFIESDTYANDRVALKLLDEEDGQQIAVATVNIPEVNLESDEVIIKSWSENEGMAEALMEGNIIGPELEKIQTGFVEATVHKLLI